MMPDEKNVPVWDRLDYAHDAIVEASAGTGKTYAIQNIVLRMVRDFGYAAPEILVVTYTEKAAGELKDRIRKTLDDAGLLAADFDEMAICTIHSFCKRIIDEYAFESGMPMRCEICPSPDELYVRAADDVVRSAAFRARHWGRVVESGKSIDAIIADALADFGSPARLKKTVGLVRDVVDDPALLDAVEIVDVLRVEIYRRTEELKAAEGLVTYDDLVAKAADVVADAARGACPRLVESLRRRHRVALVDEFQDTDEKQWEIFRALFSCAVNRLPGARAGFLIVVGDPKQAIYSFRGADVAVYCRARDEIVAASSAPPLTLAATYRSTRSLVDAFNVMFGDSGGKGWFEDGAAGEGIAYSPVKFPYANPKFADLAREDEISPVVLLESVPERISPGGSNSSNAHFGSPADVLATFCASAAAEMKRLVASSPDGAKPPRAFKYGDMCVLVDGKASAAKVREVLARHAIPFGQYKRRGVFASAEAEGVAALFRFLACPSGRGLRQALLVSPLFAVHPSALDSLPQDFEAQFDALAVRLSDLARRRDWVRLFECVMNAECSALARPTGDIGAFNRTRAAVRQIFDALAADQNARRSRDCMELAEAMQRLREIDRTAGENGALYEKESSADRVQIMTMHASKGLQFPIVFLASGFSSGKHNKIPPDELALLRQERRRLFYVALTRAEHRIYLPWSRRAWRWECKIGKKDKLFAGYGIGSNGSPLASGGFLADAIIKWFEKFERFEKFGRDALVASRLERFEKFERFDRLNRENPKISQSPNPPISQSPKFYDLSSLRNRRLRWESFTSLSSHTSQTSQTSQTIKLSNRQTVKPSNRQTLLPRSNITGNVFHQTMEALCKNDEAAGAVGFSNASDPAFEERLLDTIRAAMRRNALANLESGGDSTERALLRMVRGALDTKIKIGDTVFALAQIPRRDRLAEVDFVLPGAMPDGIDSPIVLNGQIDLLVRIGSRAFIIDWKTNTLADYTPECVRQAMDDANYHLQYTLYALAAKEWLRPRGLALAGVAYLFVRGAENGLAPGLFVNEESRTCGFSRVKNDNSNKEMRL